jgi:signal peptidase I
MSEEPTTANSESKPASTRVYASGRAGARRTTWVQQVCQCVVISVLAMTSYLLISHFFLQSVTVMGRSMTPTLLDSQRYLLNRWVFLVRAPQRQEVVVIRDLIDNSYAVKRIVAGPGDDVRISEGKLFLNGAELKETYLDSGTQTFPPPDKKEQEFRCGKDEYFVLGDNRMNSADSRIYGPVPRSHILGLIIR